MPEFDMTSLSTIDRERIIAVALEGRPFKEIAAAVGIGVRTLFTAMEDAQFRSALIQARDNGIDVLVDEIMTIARDEEMPVDRARLLCDNIKWIAARRAHKRYGDRLDVSVNGSIDIASTLTEARSRIMQPMRNLDDVTDVQIVDTQGVARIAPTDSQSVQGETGAEPSIFD